MPEFVRGRETLNAERALRGHEHTWNGIRKIRAEKTSERTEEQREVDAKHCVEHIHAAALPLHLPLAAELNVQPRCGHRAVTYRSSVVGSHAYSCPARERARRYSTKRPSSSRSCSDNSAARRARCATLAGNAAAPASSPVK